MLTRRNYLAAAVAGATALMAGCSGEKDEAPASAGNVLVAYFSATGNTEHLIQKGTDPF